MESERAEMSVGVGLANGGHAANGVAVNGVAGSMGRDTDEMSAATNAALSLVNGTGKEVDGSHAGQILQQAPPELLEMLSTEFYLPMATLISRCAQDCWNDLLAVVDKFAKLPQSSHAAPVGALQPNDQSKLNLDKKDDLLRFAQKHKETFIKLLVLLAWSKHGEDVRKTIEINFWIVQRRIAFINATFTVGQMMRDLANSQMPNPDLDTAAEVLAVGRVSRLPDLGYLARPPLSSKQILRTLKRLNSTLCTRMTLDAEIPIPMRSFWIHDGRITFQIPGEFELDLSLLHETQDAKFLAVDLRFMFSPAPSIPEQLHSGIIRYIDSAIEQNGLQGAYNLLHDLTLTYQLNELHNQARELSQGLWAGHLRVEMLRRTLVVQYWTKRRGPKSWFEIGIGRGHLSANAVGNGGTPRLQIRWLRDGRATETHDIKLDQPHLSLENTLRQVIAHHIGSLFDAVYDKLALSTLYSDADLELNQCSSSTNPVECVLDIQLSQAEYLNARIEPVSGTLILGPANDRTNRVQEELSRSRNLPDDFVTRVSYLRCLIAESNLLRTVSSSEWQHLQGLRLSATELEGIFAQLVIRASFFRLPHWTSSWMLAVTHSSTGDHWWLTKRVADGDIGSARFTQLIKSRPLHVDGPLDLAYLERLAEYTSGLIMLQSNAQHLNKKRIPFSLPEIPRFSTDCKLPSLRFERHAQTHVRPASASCIHPDIELTYHGSDNKSHKANMIARAKFTAEASNLKELAASQLDSSVAIFPTTKQVMIRVAAETGVTVADEIVSKLDHVDNIVACAATVKRSVSHSLESLSLHSITITYASRQERQLSLVIFFATATQGLQIEFLPVEDNPHQHMTPFVVQMLTRPNQSLSKNLEDVLALIRMTQPLMLYLDKLQSIGHEGVSQSSTMTTADTKNLLRVHILPRQAASYAVHYFAHTDAFTRDVSGPETPKRLLVRLEVLPLTRGGQTMWVVRPAIEEFMTYTRPSYTSIALKQKLRNEVFAKETSDWLRLDDGAAVSAVQPENLLTKVHECIASWLADALEARPPNPLPSDIKVNGPALKNALSEKKPSTPLASTRPGVGPKSGSKANGIQLHGPMSRPGSMHGNNVKNVPVKKEVITLD